MNSTVKVAVDFNNGNQPIIEIIYKESDDIRDGLIKAFLERFGHASNWCRIDWVQNHIPDGVKTEFQRIHISAITPEKIKSEAAMMLGPQKAVPEMINIHDNSNGFRNLLDEKGIKWKPNEHFTLIDASIDLFELGQQVEKARSQATVK